MFGLLALAFIAVPVVEIWLIIEVGGRIGAPSTIGIIVVTAIVGAALARHQGFATIQKIQRGMQTGREVGQSLVEGALVLVAGVMMLLPGFVTDGVGILLLLPPVRRPLAAVLVARGRRHMERSGYVVIDVDGVNGPAGPHVRDRDDDDRPPPGVIDV